MNPVLFETKDELSSAYKSLFLAIKDADYEVASVILTIFPDLNTKRYVFDIQQNIFLNDTHLEALMFKGKKFVSFAKMQDERDLINPTSRSTTVLDIATARGDDVQIAFLRPIFEKYQKEVQEAQDFMQKSKMLSIYAEN